MLVLRPWLSWTSHATDYCWFQTTGRPVARIRLDRILFHHARLEAKEVEVRSKGGGACGALAGELKACSEDRPCLAGPTPRRTMLNDADDNCSPIRRRSRPGERLDTTHLRDYDMITRFMLLNSITTSMI